jgi:type VI secretion system secreted protein VgrG
MLDQHACPAVSISGADGVGMVMLGSPTVLINNMMACRMGDIVVEIPGLALGPADPIIMGEPTVMIGEVGMGTPVVVPPVPPMVLLAQAMSGSGTTGPSSAGGSLAEASQSGIPFIKPCQGCEALQSATPSASQTGHWVEIELLDEAGKPVPGEHYQIELPDGSTTEGTLDSQGQARVDGIDPGNCKISFPNIDKKSWRKK